MGLKEELDKELKEEPMTDDFVVEPRLDGVIGDDEIENSISVEWDDGASGIKLLPDGTTRTWGRYDPDDAAKSLWEAMIGINPYPNVEKMCAEAFVKGGTDAKLIVWKTDDPSVDAGQVYLVAKILKGVMPNAVLVVLPTDHELDALTDAELLQVGLQRIKQ